jgi:hypothetical protein
MYTAGGGRGERLGINPREQAIKYPNRTLVQRPLPLYTGERRNIGILLGAGELRVPHSSRRDCCTPQGRRAGGCTTQGKAIAHHSEVDGFIALVEAAAHYSGGWSGIAGCTNQREAAARHMGVELPKGCCCTS